jgi:hypothetical protein
MDKDLVKLSRKAALKERAEAEGAGSPDGAAGDANQQPFH